MKTIKKFKNFERINEAQNPLEQAYLDEIKRRAGDDGMEKMRNGEILEPGAFFRSLEEIQSIQAESDNRERLESLAKNVIMGEFGKLLQGVDLNMNIVDKNSEEFQEMHKKMVRDETESEERKGETKEEDNQEEDNQEVDIPSIDMPEVDITAEVNKRKLINLFVQGTAKNLHRILHSETSRDGLNEIDPRLFDLFDKTIKTTEFMEWKIPEEHGADAIQHNASGMNEIDWEDKDDANDEGAEEFVDDCEDGECDINEHDMDLSGGNPVINAIGIDYMVLLHEAVKGIFSMIAQNGYASLDVDTQMNVLAQTDTLADEFHDLKYGTYIKRDLTDFIISNQKTDGINNIVGLVFDLMVGYPADNGEFTYVELVLGMIKNDSRSRSIIDDMIDSIYEKHQDYRRRSGVYDAEQALNNDAPNIPNVNNRPEIGTTTVDDILGTTSPDVVDTNPAEPQSLDYSQMSQRDLKDEMDAALDDGDYDTAKKIQPFLENKNNLSRFETFKRK